MECEEARHKMGALLETQLDENEIEPLIVHMESCYRCRDAYVELLKIRKSKQGQPAERTSREWFDGLERKPIRKVTGIAGRVFFIGSYVILIGYTLYQLFADANEKIALRIIIGGIVAGFLTLLGVTIADRIRESRHDKYKGVMK